MGGSRGRLVAPSSVVTALSRLSSSKNCWGNQIGLALRIYSEFMVTGGAHTLVVFLIYGSSRPGFLRVSPAILLPLSFPAWEYIP